MIVRRSAPFACGGREVPMTTPLSSEPRPGSRPLSTPVVVLSCATLLVGCLVFARYAFRVGARPVAIIALAIFVIGLLGLDHRARPRRPLPRLGTVVALAALGGRRRERDLLVPTLDRPGPEMVPGCSTALMGGPVAPSARQPAAADAP
jgi:MFS family permease